MENNVLCKEPLLFEDDRIDRFYIGGKVLNSWRRMPEVEDSHHCEELLCTSIGAISAGKPKGYGVSRTIKEQGGLKLNDILKKYPNEILGNKFHKYNPYQLSVLARVGDTTVRLPLQCHLRKYDAKKFFHMNMGKTEAWYIARVRDDNGEKPCVYVGFKEGVTKELWEKLYDEQDSEKMISCLNRIPVTQGSVILVPAGTPHACGPNCLFVEFHECNDVTIRVEKHINGLDLKDIELFNGLDKEEGLNLFDYSTYSEEEAITRFVMKPKTIQENDQFCSYSFITEKENPSFGVSEINLYGEYVLPEFDGHRILIATDGDVVMKYGDKKTVLIQGHAALVGAQCALLTLYGINSRVMVGKPYLEGEK